MSYYDELKFARTVNDQARKITAAVAAGRLELAQKYAFELCSFAANRHSNLLIGNENTSVCPGKYDLAALMMRVDMSARPFEIEEQ